MHVFRVGLWLAVTSLILVHAPVQAEWLALEARYLLHPLQTAYVEPGTIHRLFLFGRGSVPNYGSTAQSRSDERNDMQPTGCYWLTVDSGSPTARHSLL